MAALGLATLLPLIDLLGRHFGGFHVPASGAYVQQLTLWLAFVGGLAATSEGTHLTLSTTELFEEGPLRRRARLFAYTVAAAVIAVTLLWLVGQLVASTRQRIPAYDLPADPPGETSSGAARERDGGDELAGHPGGER